MQPPNPPPPPPPHTHTHTHTHFYATAWCVHECVYSDYPHQIVPVLEKFLVQLISDTLLRLILIAEKDTVYEKFPTPLINRMEKHFVLTSSILDERQETMLKEFDDWIVKFSSPG